MSIEGIGATISMGSLSLPFEDGYDIKNLPDKCFEMPRVLNCNISYLAEYEKDFDTSGIVETWIFYKLKKHIKHKKTNRGRISKRQRKKYPKYKRKKIYSANCKINSISQNEKGNLNLEIGLNNEQ